MANAVYPLFKQAQLTADSNIDLENGTVKVILVDTADYTYNAGHDFLDDVPSGARVATSGALTGKTILNGVFDADNVTLSGVTGDPCEALIIFIDTGAEGTSRLFAYMDTGVTGLPVTPNGGDINIVWNASGIVAT